MGPNLGPKMEPTWATNRSKNQSFFGCLLESIFAWILIDFLPKLAPFWDPSWNPRAAQDGPKTLPKTFPRRHQDSPRATRLSKIEIWSIFGPKVRWGTPPWPRFSRFLARLNSNVGAKFALGNLESFTSNFKIQKVNSSPNHPMSTQTSINFPST